MRSLFLALVTVAALGVPSRAQAPLPLVADAEWLPLRDHARQLVQALEKAGNPLPPATLARLRPLLEGKVEDGLVAAVELQEVIDPLCLIGVTINPESRVKATRGLGKVALVLGRPTLALVKISNDGGVRHPLAVEGAELLNVKEKSPDAWLEAEVLSPPPLTRGLSGKRVEYRVLRLLPRQSGAREVTLRFDVGQGTEDLGFRAEVPILFRVAPR